MLAAVAAALGCAKIPSGRSAVDAVRLEGNETIDSGDIEEKIATQASPKFLGLWSGVVFDYELFDRYVFRTANGQLIPKQTSIPASK